MFLHLIIALIVIYIILCIYLIQLFAGKSRRTITGKTCLIIAHPDDESMFFGPTILNGSEDNKNSLYVLCLSYGNYYGDGMIRKKELYEAIKVAGIPESNLKIIDNKLLPDDPSQKWDTKIIHDLIMEEISRNDIKNIVTFDSKGNQVFPLQSLLTLKDNA